MVSTPTENRVQAFPSPNQTEWGSEVWVKSQSIKTPAVIQWILLSVLEKKESNTKLTGKSLFHSHVEVDIPLVLVRQLQFLDDVKFNHGFAINGDDLAHRSLEERLDDSAEDGGVGGDGSFAWRGERFMEINTGAL
jgi:hypothetical protein